MIKKLLPLVLLLIGLGAGVGAGIFMRPAPEMSSANVTAEPAMVVDKAPDEAPNLDREYVKMNNQFVVPIVNGEHVQGLVVMSLSLEVANGQKDAIYAREPKLRDSFLQVLFDHANIGGFDGAFTNANNLAVLRGALREVAQKDMGDTVTDVLIVEIARQDY
ncbi:flagellar basal body-associated FliL family protein [uncultured Tateyamaria sp.]|uniref:flagellar basal body-associated FliL family protein n=1 Tax=uncultured Tateyamaria sp. TaxID=455651 RepID=UPI0026364F0D|nr:flagellar basal body-associated FliL family protein [uncultured Tateyamaria sp.]